MIGTHGARFSSLLILFFLLLGPALAQELKHRSAPGTPDTGQFSEVGILEHHKLAPTLRGEGRLRFSPDGSYLLVQDAAGLFLLSTQPLQILMYSDVSYAYPAQFSADSKALSVLGADLQFITWHLPDVRLPERRTLQIKEGCLDARLSPGAEWISCTTPDLAVNIYRTSDLQRVAVERVQVLSGNNLVIALPRSLPSFLSAPFGIHAAHSFEVLANRRMHHSAHFFSPDGSSLFVFAGSESFRLNLPAGAKAGLPGALRKTDHPFLAAASSDQLVVAGERGKDAPPHLVSASSGQTLAALNFTSTVVGPASDPHYLLLWDQENVKASLFDLARNTPLTLPPSIAADILGGHLALLNSAGQVSLYKLGEPHAFAAGRLPVTSLPSLSGAMADPDLSSLLFSESGISASFDVHSGNRLAVLPGFDAIAFLAPDSAMLSAPTSRSQVHMHRWSRAASDSPSRPEWTNDALELVSSQHAFIGFYFHNSQASRSRVPEFYRDAFMPFELRALDPGTGNQLWKRDFTDSGPVPFSDPQGQRIVFGWKAQADGAWRVVHKFPALKDAYQRSKVKDFDSMFEVLDAATGQTLGGVLVQAGSGPESFDAAFSVGDFLFLVKDRVRMTVYSLKQSTMIERMRVEVPAVSEPRNLLAYDAGNGHLLFFDLAAGKVVADRPLPDTVAYLRFSADGGRLLLLTIHQEAFILDVPATISAFPPKPAASPGSP